MVRPRKEPVSGRKVPCITGKKGNTNPGREGVCYRFSAKVVMCRDGMDRGVSSVRVKSKKLERSRETVQLLLRLKEMRLRENGENKV